MTENMKTQAGGVNPIIIRFALIHLRALKAADAAYEEEVREWYQSGDGRSRSQGGKGYAFPYCRHGMSLWTDYDNICGGCEAGEGNYTIALRMGYASHAEVERRMAAIYALPADVPQVARDEMVQWAIAAFPK